MLFLILINYSYGINNSMKTIDKYLQNVRISKAKKYIRRNDSVLDIGTADGTMFEKWRGFIKSGVGIDPRLRAMVETDLYTLLPGYFPGTCPDGVTYDVITMLAVLEHIPSTVQATLAERCFSLLNKNGRLIITVPSPRVDYIINILIRLKLMEAIGFEEHYGYKPAQTTQIFSDKYFKLIDKQNFQMGLNNLFVFEKII
jgi:2-polyprenyl-3-methyl-5-hydroxy-6-metoxy-1,4-benzoquinol methylase